MRCVPPVLMVVVVLAGVVPGDAQARTRAEVLAAIGRTAQEEAEFLALEADLFETGTLRADAGAAREIQRLLRDIRDGFPELRKVIPPPYRQTSMYVAVVAEKKGLVDAITRRFGGEVQKDRPAWPGSCDQELPKGHTCTLRIDFPGLLHAPSLAGLYWETGAVVRVDVNGYIGWPHLLIVERTGTEWRIVFGIGSGDCPSGCTGWRYVFFDALPGGPAKKVGEWRIGLAGDSGREHWKFRRHARDLNPKQ